MRNTSKAVKRTGHALPTVATASMHFLVKIIICALDGSPPLADALPHQVQKNVPSLLSHW